MGSCSDKKLCAVTRGGVCPQKKAQIVEGRAVFMYLLVSLLQYHVFYFLQGQQCGNIYTSHFFFCKNLREDGAIGFCVCVSVICFPFLYLIFALRYIN